MIDGHTFEKAYFSNNERTEVELYFRNDNPQNVDDEMRVEFCPAEDGDEVYDWLLTQITIDELHESTFKHIAQQDAIYREAIVEIGKQEGLIYDIDNINTDIYKAIAHCVFADFDDEKDKDKLFMYKISLFEADQIKNCTDKELKTKLRRSTNIVEATKVAIEIVESISGTSQ
jgi:hypothetical protein